MTILMSYLTIKFFILTLLVTYCITIIYLVYKLVTPCSYLVHIFQVRYRCSQEIVEIVEIDEITGWHMSRQRDFFKIIIHYTL